MTSLPVLIFTCSKTNSKQLGGDVGGRRVVGFEPVRSGSYLVVVEICSESDLDPICLSVNPV